MCQKTITTKSKIQSYTDTHIIQHWELECYLGFHSYSVLRYSNHDKQPYKENKDIYNEPLKNMTLPWIDFLNIVIVYWINTYFLPS